MALKNSQYDAIMREYQKKQLDNKHSQDLRIQYAYDLIPRLKAIDDEIASLSVAQGKRLIFGDNAALADLKLQLNMLRSERSSLLSSNGLEENYLLPHYHCALCNDTGYLENNKKCRCFEVEAIKLLYAQSNLSSHLTQENFETFTYQYFSNAEHDTITELTQLDNMKHIFSVCKSFTENFKTNKQNLLFYGSVGTGKTFLSHCIAKELLDHSYSVIYFTAFDLFNTLAKHTFENRNTLDSELTSQEHIFNCDLLIIDDLGTELTNSFVSSQLFMCINERNLHKKCTLISTNLSLETLIDIYSERTFSRISSTYTLLRFFGKDIRIVKKLDRRKP